LGYSGDEIRGLKLLIVEDDADVSDSILYVGLIGDRDYQQADSLNQGVSRRISPSVRDLNALVDLRELRGAIWNRPAETAGTRLAALIASGYFSGITDQGLVVYPHHGLDPADYRGMRPSNVLNDVIKGINWNWFVYWDSGASLPALFLDNSNRSDAYASLLRLSNVDTDVDSRIDPTPVLGATKTYAIDGKAKLNRSPEQVYSGVSVPGSKLTYHQDDPAIAATFIARDGSAPDANTKTAKQAAKIATSFLAISRAETDRIETAVILPASEHASIKAGMLISARFREFPAYASFSYFRVVRRAIAQPMKTDDRYRIPLTLSPATPFSCVGVPDINEAHGTVTGAVSVIAGTTVWAHATISGWFGGPIDTAVSTVPVYDPTNANDGDPDTFSECRQQNFRNSGTVALDWIATLDDDYILCSTKGTYEVGSTSWRSRPPTTIEYWDGAAWQAAAGSLSYDTVSSPPRYWTFAFTTPITTTKLRWRYLQSGAAGIAGLWGWNALGTRVYDMQIMGVAA
jgi:hypothetical protein